MKGFRPTISYALPLLVTAILGFSVSSAIAQSVDSLPKPTDYVSDNAHVLSPDAVAHIDAIASQLDHSQANAQLAVVTVNTLNGEDAADYANQLEDKWKMGRKGSDRGVLILLAVQDHKRRIDVGYGLEGILPDGKLGDIGREMVPDLRSNDFDGAVTLAVNEIAQVIAADAKVTLTGAEPVPVQSQAHHSAALAKLILIIVILIFFGGFHLLRFLFGFGLFSSFLGGGGGGFGGGGGGFGGGGGGGGGGFGGFGGGSFGGGGAGGDW